jgi:hypothetical protein
MLKISIFLFILLIGYVGFQIFRKKRLESRQYKEFLSVFENQNITLPVLKFGWTYSWPTFTVMFANQVDFEYATQNKMCEQFNRKIEAFYNSEFEAERAIIYNYMDKK